MKVKLVDEVGIRIAERLGAEVDKTDEHGFALVTDYQNGVKDGLRIALQIMQDLGCSAASYTYMANTAQQARAQSLETRATQSLVADMERDGLL